MWGKPLVCQHLVIRHSDYCAVCAVPLAPHGVENLVRRQIIVFPLPCSK
jgi:hypothetical protein